MIDDASKALAENVKLLIETERPEITNVDLGKLAGIAPNSVYYMMEPAKRTPKQDGQYGSTKVAHVSKLAAVFQREAWQLLLPRDTLGAEMHGILMARKRPAKPRLTSVGGNTDGPLNVPGELHTPRAKGLSHRRK